MAKLTLSDITGGYQTATAYNANNALIEAALENTLSLDGTTPNSMTANLDINSQDITNVANIGVTGTATLANLILNGTVVSTTTVLTGGLDATEVAFTPTAGALTTLQVALDDDYLRNDEDGALTGALTATGVVTGLTIEATGDTAAADAAAIGYTAAEGLVLTGTGGTNDITLKNTADAEVMGVLTGTTNVAFTGTVTATDLPKFKIVDMGDWDMAATTSINVAHGLTLSTIRSVSAMIRKDDATAHWQFGADAQSGQALSFTLGETNVTLTREVGSDFDTGVDWNATTYNRGWITITYV